VIFWLTFTFWNNVFELVVLKESLRVAFEIFPRLKSAPVCTAFVPTNIFEAFKEPETLTFPITSKASDGEVVPMPTLPELISSRIEILI